MSTKYKFEVWALNDGIFFSTKDSGWSFCKLIFTGPFVSQICAKAVCTGTCKGSAVPPIVTTKDKFAEDLHQTQSPNDSTQTELSQGSPLLSSVGSWA